MKCCMISWSSLRQSKTFRYVSVWWIISDHTTYHVSSVFIYRNSIHTAGSQLSLSAKFACSLSTLGVSVSGGSMADTDWGNARHNWCHAGIIVGACTVLVTDFADAFHWAVTIWLLHVLVVGWSLVFLACLMFVLLAHSLCVVSRGFERPIYQYLLIVFYWLAQSSLFYWPGRCLF